MGVLEIVLLLVGLVIFILSFIIPEKKEKVSKKDQSLGYELIGKMVDEQMSSVSLQIEELLDEKDQMHLERIERRMERMSNEKIMALGEYSDTVLEDIKKNHDEVVFLYDMLNAKHKAIMEALEKVDKKCAEQEKIIEQKMKSKQEVVITEQKQFQPLQPRVVEVKKAMVPEERPSKKKRMPEKTKENKKDEENGKVAIQFSKNTSLGQNSNKRILQLHKEGKSNMVIAKELGLGIGEVKLVIDLFKGI